MCPGRARSRGRVAGSISDAMVRARSDAEIPVVVPFLASTETVNAVRFDSVFSLTIGGRAGSAGRPSAVRAPDPTDGRGTEQSLAPAVRRIAPPSRAPALL